MRKLDDKRVGLLIRMSYHRACVCSKAIMAPLLRRKFVTPSSTGRTYRLTPSGMAFVESFLANNKTLKLHSYGGVSIGNEVMIVVDKQVVARSLRKKGRNL